MSVLWHKLQLAQPQQALRPEMPQCFLCSRCGVPTLEAFLYDTVIKCSVCASLYGKGGKTCSLLSCMMEGDSDNPHCLLVLVETAARVYMLRTNNPSMYHGARIIGETPAVTERQLARFEQNAIDAMACAAHELRKGEGSAKIRTTLQQRFALFYLAAVGIGSDDSLTVFMSDTGKCEFILAPDTLLRVDTSLDIAVFFLQPADDVTVFQVLGCAVFRAGATDIADIDLCAANQTVCPFQRVSNLHPMTCLSVIDVGLFRMPAVTLTKENIAHPLTTAFPSGGVVLCAIWVPFGWIFLHTGGTGAYVLFREWPKTALIIRLCTREQVQFDLLVHPSSYPYNTPMVWSSMLLTDDTHIEQGHAALCTTQTTDSVLALTMTATNSSVTALFTIPPID